MRNTKNKTQKKKLIDKLTHVERKFLLDYKLPGIKDKTGINALSVDFRNKFGFRYDGLNLSEGKLYNLASRVRSEAKSKASKKRTRKPKMKKKSTKTAAKKLPFYSKKEIDWFKKQPLPVGKKGYIELADKYKERFPDKPHRTPEALAWKLNNVHGKWNYSRKKTKKSKKRVIKSVKKLKRHKHSRASNAWIKKQVHPQYSDEKLKKELAGKFNTLYSDELNPSISPGAYYEQSAKVHGLRKKTRKGRKSRRASDKRLKYTPELDAFLMAMIPKGRKFKSKELKQLHKDFKDFSGLDVSERALEVKCSRLRKKREESEEKLKISASQIRVITPEPSAAGDEFILVDGDKVIWRGDHEPKETTVYGGVSRNGTGKSSAVCTMSIDGEVLQKIFKDHKPTPVIYKKVKKSL